ncbi:hypothetical protein Tco_1022813 [Tanacetum coccineum]
MPSFVLWKGKLVNMVTTYEGNEDAYWGHRHMCTGIDILDEGVSPSTNISSELETLKRFSFLKRHRVGKCGFDIDEILNEEGNIFRYVLNTRALICSVIKNSRDGSLNEALAGKEEFLISSLAKNSIGRGIIDKYTHSYFYPDLYLDRHTFLIVHL